MSASSASSVRVLRWECCSKHFVSPQARQTRTKLTSAYSAQRTTLRGPLRALLSFPVYCGAPACTGRRSPCRFGAGTCCRRSSWPTSRSRTGRQPRTAQKGHRKVFLSIRGNLTMRLALGEAGWRRVRRQQVQQPWRPKEHCANAPAALYGCQASTGNARWEPSATHRFARAQG